MTQLFEKNGRRYVPWGNGTRWHTDFDAMPIGTYRLIHCPAPGHYRQQSIVDPDRAGFLAAAMEAEQAMVDAMQAAAIGRPSGGVAHCTPKQQAIIKRFQAEMAAAGGLLPVMWQHGSAREIAQAGVEAVRQHMEDQQ